MKYRPLARERDVQLTMAHDDWEVSSVTGCGAMVDVVEQSEDATRCFGFGFVVSRGK